MIMTNRLRGALTEALAQHLFTEITMRGDGRCDWNLVAEKAMEFMYGDVPQQEQPKIPTPVSPSDSGRDPDGGGCCGGGCCGSGGEPDVRPTLLGVVDPPTTPASRWAEGPCVTYDPRSQTVGYAPAPGSGTCDQVQ